MSTMNGAGDRAGVSSLAAGDGRSARRTRTRRMVLDAASELFADKGFSGTSTEDVAERAGVSKGSIFYNFGTKENLGEAAITEGATQLHDAVVQAHGGTYGWVALDAAVMAVLRSVDATPDRCQMLTTELFRPGRRWSGQLVEIRATMLEPLIAILIEVHSERRQAGISTQPEQPDPVHLHAVAMSVFGALMFTALDRRAFPSGDSLEQVHERLMVTISGLKG